jgi:hypothetical protein
LIVDANTTVRPDQVATLVKDSARRIQRTNRQRVVSVNGGPGARSATWPAMSAPSRERCRYLKGTRSGSPGRSTA